MRTLIAAGALGLAVFVWSTAGAQVQREPTPGSGIVTVTGTVEVAKTVRAEQSGDWKVAVANVPDVRVSNTPAVTFRAPDFLKARARYAIVWPNGDREQVVVEQIGADGWLRVDAARWINVAAARSLEAMR